MRNFFLLAAPLLSSLIQAQELGSYFNGTAGNSTVAGGAPGPNADGKYTISAPGIRANYIPYGASISNLFINDTRGIERDIVLGFDNASYYSIDKQHPHLGAVPGRYANRIKNSTFEIDGVVSHIIPNENGGADTLHGGPDGWDYRNWTVVAHTESSITFSITDPDGKEGFPGEVVSFVTYSVSNMTLDYKMVAVATTKKTPIMLSSHTYWNLDGFQNPDTPLVLNHTLSLPFSGQRIGVDGILIPDGSILANQQNSVNDFWSTPKQIGANFTSPDLVNNCGTGCIGYDTAFLVTRQSPYNWRESGPVAVLSSAWSGIRVSVYSDQEAYQIYSCGGQNGSLTLKNTQGLTDGSRPRTVQQYGCVVMEVEDWIDGINQPEWGRAEKQIFGPDTDPYVLQASLKFDLLGAEQGCQVGGESGSGETPGLAGGIGTLPLEGLVSGSVSAAASSATASAAAASSTTTTVVTVGPTGAMDVATAAPTTSFVMEGPSGTPVVAGPSNAITSTSTSSATFATVTTSAAAGSKSSSSLSLLATLALSLFFAVLA